MIKRIVKMRFRADEVGTFINIFENNRLKIAAFKGCQSVELLCDKKVPEIFFTYSLWESEENLEEYRQSELFKRTNIFFVSLANEIKYRLHFPFFQAILLCQKVFIDLNPKNTIFLINIITSS